MLYEDDYEYEEQPAHIRDRAVPGSRAPGGRGGFRGGNGGGRRRSGPPQRSAPRDNTVYEFPEAAIPVRDLLAEMLRKMGLNELEIRYIPRPEGEYLEINGPNLAMLIGKHGNTLEAINLIFNNMLNVGVRNNRRYYTIDAEGYRADRAEDLKALAIESRDRVIRERKPCKLEPMLPSERKIVHLTIADSEEVRTESEGAEPDRCVVIFPR